MDIFCNNAGIVNELEWQKCISINLVRKCDPPPRFLLTVLLTSVSVGGR